MFDCIRECFRDECDSWQSVFVGRTVAGQRMWLHSIHVDRSASARGWAQAKGLMLADVLCSEKGAAYEIWWSNQFAVAIPVQRKV